MTPHEHLPGCDERHTARQACNTRAREAVPAHLSRDGESGRQPAAVATAIMSDTAVRFEPQRTLEGSHGLADGPVDSIDTAHIPALPLVALAAVTLACIFVLWRVLSGRRDRRARSA